MKTTNQVKREIRTYFGKSPRPYQEGYYTKEMKIREEKNEIILDCTRCHKERRITEYKIHPDGAISFVFNCYNCQLVFAVYRNSYDDIEKVRKALYK